MCQLVARTDRSPWKRLYLCSSLARRVMYFAGNSASAAMSARPTLSGVFELANRKQGLICHIFDDFKSWLVATTPIVNLLRVYCSWVGRNCRNLTVRYNEVWMFHHKSANNIKKQESEMRSAKFLSESCIPKRELLDCRVENVQKQKLNCSVTNVPWHYSLGGKCPVKNCVSNTPNDNGSQSQMPINVQQATRYVLVKYKWRYIKVV